MLKQTTCLLCLLLISPADAAVSKHKHAKKAEKGNSVTRSLDPEAMMESIGEEPGAATADEGTTATQVTRLVPLPPERPRQAAPEVVAMLQPEPAPQTKTETVVAVAPASIPAFVPKDAPAGKSALIAMIERHAAEHGVPVELVHRVVMRESRYNPGLHHRAYWGLMQIRPDTARSMGYQGSPSGLLDAETNLTYAVPYLANAYMVAGGNQNRAVALYAGGYYYEAKRKRMLDRLHTAKSARTAQAAEATTQK